MADFEEATRFPANYLEASDRYLIPLVKKMILELKDSDPAIIGISAPQGSGKTTLAQFLALLLKKESLTTEVISIDDFYLTKQERTILARKVHPLLLTRGVPGTHDIAQLDYTFNRLKKKQSATVPIFDKLTDDRVGDRKIECPDFILFEGWCLGCSQIPSFEIPPEVKAFNLNHPLNRLEEHEDPDFTWRNYVRLHLSDYQRIFDQINYLIYLKIPDFNLVYQWRKKQELTLAQQKSKKVSMDQEALKRFIQHYERITRQLMYLLPNVSDAVLTINREHKFTQLSYPR